MLKLTINYYPKNLIIGGTLSILKPKLLADNYNLKTIKSSSLFNKEEKNKAQKYLEGIRIIDIKLGLCLANISNLEYNHKITYRNSVIKMNNLYNYCEKKRLIYLIGIVKDNIFSKLDNFKNQTLNEIKNLKIKY